MTASGGRANKEAKKIKWAIRVGRRFKRQMFCVWKRQMFPLSPLRHRAETIEGMVGRQLPHQGERPLRKVAGRISIPDSRLKTGGQLQAVAVYDDSPS